MPIKSTAPKYHQHLFQNTILGIAFCVWVYLAVYLVQAGALERGEHLFKFALVVILVLLSAVVWWFTRIISQDVVHLARRDIQTALPILISLGLGTFYCLWQYKDEPLLLAGAFFGVLLVTQVSASCHDYFPDKPAVSLVFNLLLGAVILIVFQAHLDFASPFYFQVVVMILILAAYEYVKRSCIESPGGSPPSSPTWQSGSSFGEATLILITDIVTTTFIMGFKVNLAVFWAFLVFYASTFHLHSSGEALVATAMTFYDICVQVQGILLALVAGFGALVLQQQEKSTNRRRIMSKALQGFVGFYVFALLVYMTAILVCRGIDFDLIHWPLEIDTPWTASCMMGVLLFEVSWLTIPPSLMYLYSLISVFLEWDV